MHKSSTSPASEVVADPHVQSFEEVSAQKGQEVMHRGTDWLPPQSPVPLFYLAEGTGRKEAPRKRKENRSAQSCQNVRTTGVLRNFEEKASILLKSLSFSGNELTLWCVISVEIYVSWSFCPPDSFCVSILFCHRFPDDKPKGRLYLYSKHKLIKRTKSLNDHFVHAKYISQKSTGPLFFHIIFKWGHCLCLFKNAEKSYKFEKMVF